MATPGISWIGVIWRLVFAIALVVLTFNPSGLSVYHWLLGAQVDVAAKALVGIALLIGWIVCLRTAFVALGLIGVVLCAALLGTFVWLLFDLNVLQTTDSTALAWIGLVILGIVLGIGLSWALIRARTTGQLEVQ